MCKAITTAVAIVVAILQGCATTLSNPAAEQSIMQSWQGVSADEMVGYWGAPSNRYERDGKQILAWGYNQCQREVTVKDGIVVGGESHGTGCCVMTVSGYCKGLLNPKRS